MKCGAEAFKLACFLRGGFLKDNGPRAENSCRAPERLLWASQDGAPWSQKLGPACQEREVHVFAMSCVHRRHRINAC